MTKLIIDISKYVLLVLIALYALQSYIIFKKKNEEAREFLFLRQNVLMFAIHFIAFTVFYLKMDESTLFYFYGAQAIHLEQCWCFLGIFIPGHPSFWSTICVC